MYFGAYPSLRWLLEKKNFVLFFLYAPTGGGQLRCPKFEDELNQKKKEGRNGVMSDSLRLLLQPVSQQA